jgi:nucleotide-binding universal stress UspA family protein
MKILIAVDFSEMTDKIIDATKAIALKTNSFLWLIHVVQPEPDFIGYEVGPPSQRHIIAQKFQEEHVHLQEVAKSMKKDGFNVTPLLVQGPTIETILNEADKLTVDMIITGSHGHGKMIHLLVGSVSKGILKKSKVPVLVVPMGE